MNEFLDTHRIDPERFLGYNKIVYRAGHGDAAGDVDAVDAQEVLQDDSQDQPHHDAVEEGVPHDEHCMP